MHADSLEQLTGLLSYGQKRGEPMPPASIAGLIDEFFEGDAEPWWSSRRRQLEDERD